MLFQTKIFSLVLNENEGREFRSKGLFSGCCKQCKKAVLKFQEITETLSTNFYNGYYQTMILFFVNYVGFTKAATF